MNTQEADNMKLRDLAIGAAIGFACGYMAKSILNDYQMQSPDDILTAVKQKMNETGKVIGSWILMTPEPFKKNGLQTQVFKGGLTRILDGEQKQYEFFADAKTGTIIDIVEQ